MTLTAKDIVDEIREGVIAALETSQLFLGIEQGDIQNADIHPEYVTTVKVAENLTGADRIVSLETHMKLLRRQALGVARLCAPHSRWSSIKTTLDSYRFGRKDSQRLDILVRSSDINLPPLLMVEAKLGVRNLPGVLLDVDRIVKLLQMYHDVGLLERHSIYGAVVFHLMEEERTPDSVNASSAKDTLDACSAGFLMGIQTYLQTYAAKKSWLRHKVGLLTAGVTHASVSGYQEFHDNGSVEDVFAKGSFAFAPGLVLLGNAHDITSVSF